GESEDWPRRILFKSITFPPYDADIIEPSKSGKVIARARAPTSADELKVSHENVIGTQTIVKVAARHVIERKADVTSLALKT
ncbi:MAG TPA: hypothetical protein VEO56_06215, partial [Bacteroidota bacterium]|nr:hypothetical protein [Bacteroidota bacterium]